VERGREIRHPDRTQSFDVLVETVRDVRAGETETTRFRQPTRHPWNAANLAAQPDLADRNRPFVEWCIVDGREQGEANRKIRGRLAHGKAAGDRDEYVLSRKRDVRALGRNRR
jgi:hypothetical protein